jgi:trehalose/maltose transport system substrate-binding protein
MKHTMSYQTKIRSKGHSLWKLLILTLVTVSAISCSGLKTEEGQTVVVYSYDEGGDLKEVILDDLIARFEEKNSDIKILKHALPGVTDLDRAFYLQSLGARSIFVDVFEADVIWVSEFAAGEFTLNLDKYVTEEEKALWIPAAMDQAMYNGSLYAIPYYMSYAGLFYRKDLLDKYGLKPPTTWDELISQINTVAKKEGITGLVWQGRKSEASVCSLLQFYYNMGGMINVDATKEGLHFDKNILANTLEFMVNLVEKDGLSHDDVLEHFGNETGALFGNGEALFMINTQAAALYISKGKIQDNFGIVPLPGNGIAMTGGYQLAINKLSDNPDKAVRFAKFMASEMSQQIFLEKRGQGPVLKSLYDQDFKDIPGMSALPELLKHTRARPKSTHYHNLSIMLGDELEAVLTKDKTPAEGAQAIVERGANLDFPKVAAPDFPKEFIYWY